MYIDRVRGAQLISMRILEYRRVVVSVCAVTAAVTAIAQAPTAGAPATHGGEHQHLDSRFGHNRYYYDRGYAVHSPPDGGLANLHGPDGQRYYFHGADWYRWKGSWDQSWHWQRWWHGGWVVSAAPAGVFVPLLPPAYTLVWWG
ncbi:MAG: hypothetical protein JO274_08360, partial [Gammaproteobacteria bacterium]|nr:hypothetical protein [Gammaproteobacteria bacterium]